MTRDYEVLGVDWGPSRTAYGFVRGGKLLGYFTSRKEALAWFLRHSEEWPDGFTWNYGELSLDGFGEPRGVRWVWRGCCGRSLGVELPFLDAVPRVAEWFGMSEAEVREVFYGGAFSILSPGDGGDGGGEVEEARWGLRLGTGVNISRRARRAGRAPVADAGLRGVGGEGDGRRY